MPVMRYRSYFIHEGDVTFRVENYTFRVHRFFLARESAYFRGLFEPPLVPVQESPGSSESNPYVLEGEGVTSEAFACFLWIFYNDKYSVYNATPDQWSSILWLAQKWKCQRIEEVCLEELEKLDMSPVDRIQIYQRHNLDDALLLDSYALLTMREKPIGFEDGLKLGLKTSLQIAEAREMSRGPDTGVGPRSPSAIQLDPPILHSILSNIFGLPKILTNGIAHDAGPLTAPVRPSDKVDVDRASAFSATAPTTPSKPGALSQSTSTSEANPPTIDNANVKAPPAKPEDVTKQNSRNRKQSSTSRSSFSWQL